MATTVLVVDDDPSTREYLWHWLTGWGYAVSEAGSATEALGAMLVKPAAIVLCDIRMPGHDGFWLVNRVRGKWPNTVIVMATAVDDLPTVLKAKQAGVTDYVTKPFQSEVLRQALERAKEVVASQHQ